MEPKLLAQQLQFPEGPAFDANGDLWFVELEGGCLTRWSNGDLTRHTCGGSPNGLAFDARGRAWFCDAGQNAVRCYDPAAGQSTIIVDQIDGAPLLMPNDLAFDRSGNLLFTCPGDSGDTPAGYVCCLRPDGTLVKIAEQLYFPNGLAFMDNGATLVVAETYRQRLWRGAWDSERCRWIGAQPWAEVGELPDGPDGMAVGADGLLYVAIYSGGCVKAVNPAGQVAAVYPLPGRCPTNVAFDPTGKLGMVITEAEQGQLLQCADLGPGIPLFAGSVSA